jgi:hypothetical protein
MQDLYFIRCGDEMKIGRSGNPARRMATMKTGNTRPLALVATLPGMGWQEKVWHMAFCNDRIGGEWFTVTPALEQAIAAAVSGNEWIATLPAPLPDAHDEWSDLAPDAATWRNMVADYEERMSEATSGRAKLLTISSVTGLPAPATFVASV